jgi:DNA-binding winged helix-turn-helix (wHTH) protein
VPLPNTLPVLCPGVDRLPNGCRHCGSRLLASEPPLADNRYGLLSCTGCGTELAWLDQPLPSSRQSADGRLSGGLPVRRDQHVPDAEREGERRSALPNLRTSSGANVEASRDREPQGAGCGIACIPLPSGAVFHSAGQHEEYGRRQALAEVEAQLDWPTAPIRTGCLTVDLVTERVFVNGLDPGLTPTEGAILRYVAAHLDRPCRHADIVRAVWGEAAVELAFRVRREHGRWHINRVNVARMRSKLGPAAPLVESVSGVGYRLRLVEP